MPNFNKILKVAYKSESSGEEMPVCSEGEII